MKKFLGILMGLVCLAGAFCFNTALAENQQTQKITINEPVSKIDKLLFAINQTKDAAQLSKIYSALGYEYYKINNYEQALKYFNEAEKIKGNSVLYMLKGNLLYNLDDFLNAIEYYTKAIENTDGLLTKDRIKELLGYRASAYSLLGNGKEAESDLNKILVDTDLDENLSSILWYSFLLQGKYYEALNAEEMFLTHNKTSKEALFMKADTLYELKEYEKSKATIEILEQLNAPNYKINSLWAEYYLGIEKYEQAIECLNKINKEYFNADHYSIRAEILLKMGRLKDALTDVNIAIQDTKIGYPYAYKVRGNIYAAMGKKSKAVADYKYFLSKSQNVVDNAEVQEKLKKLE